MKIYMIRHGESTANAERKHAGWAQVPLTERGRADAIAAGALIEGLHFDRVYVSDLIRARETMELALPNTEAIESPLLREISVGELAGFTAAECLEKYGEPYLTEKGRRNFRPFGGEDYDMHFSRVVEFARLLAANPVPTVAVFCHEGTIRCMLDLVEGVRHTPADTPLGNGSVSVFEFDGKSWSCAEWNRTKNA